MNLQSLLHEAERIAREAGVAIMDIYGSGFSVKEKNDRSPLTEADSAAHAVIVKGLAALEPRLPVLSEEDVSHFPGPDGAGRYWLVDPLDGTKEFIKRNGEFTVNIALIERGRPILGVVYAPVPEVAWVAATGCGAVRVAGSRRERINVSRHEPGAPWRVVGSRSHAGDSLGALLDRLGSHELLSMGSSLKFCLVAEGSADIYPRLGLTSLWDTGAAQCVVEQAGGAVIRLDGAPLDYGTPATTLNPFFLVHGNSDICWPELLGSVGL